MTTLAAAVREHFATAARLHAGAKPVGADTTKIVGLIRTLAHDLLRGFATMANSGARNQALSQKAVKTARLSQFV
jgi:hypothetical protein